MSNAIIQLHDFYVTAGQRFDGLFKSMPFQSSQTFDASGSDTADPLPTEKAVRVQLDRVLSSPAFAKSERQKRFLSFIVNETLLGRSNTLKEYAIALDVFDRDPSFNPQTNSIVRVEASRLRNKLVTYYAVDGANDPIRLCLPAGGYVPKIDILSRIDDSVSGDKGGSAAQRAVNGKRLGRLIRGGFLLLLITLLFNSFASLETASKHQPIHFAEKVRFLELGESGADVCSEKLP